MHRALVGARMSLAVCAVALASGCATITTGASQTLTLTTDPSGASCVLRREGQTIGAVNPTPGSIAVGKSHQDIVVTCSKAGFLDGDAKLSATFQAASLGNILLGGLIGVVVDAASGATAKYEPNLFVTLSPDTFDSAVARDAFFDARRTSVLERGKSAREEIEKTCRSASDCERVRKALDEEEAATLARIERDRGAARIKAAT